MSRSGNILRTVLGTGAIAAILLCLAVSAGISRSTRSGILCSGISVTIRDSAENRFVSEEDIKEYIAKEYGKTGEAPVKDLDLKKIESILDSRSAVLKSEAYCTKDGMLNISVTQRKPIMRFQKKGSGFYADADGYIFPMKEGRASYVIVIDGNIPLDLGNAGKGKATSGEERIWLDRITGLVTYMDRHRVWGEDIVQIHVQDNGDLIMIPREGREKFIFGKPVSVEEKFALMERYYTSIVPAMGKDRYSSVDVRYKGQIICR